MTRCVLIQHGLAFKHGNNSFGTCCYNSIDPTTYTSDRIDPVGCRACIDQENNNIFSYRQGANQKYGLEHNHLLPIVLDVNPNKNCDLACKICGSDSSSTWAKLENIKINSNFNMTFSDFKNKFNKIDLSQAQEINFSGGEPFLNDNVRRYIEQLSDQCDFSKLTLRLSTNGSHKLNSKLIDFFLQFALVRVRFSLDDIGTGHEYQRWPSMWKQWETNWKIFLTDMPHTVMPAINRTISLLNVNRLHLLDSWHQQYLTNKFGDPIELVDHYAFGSYSLGNLPVALKEHISQHRDVYSRAWDAVKNRSTITDLTDLRQIIIKHDQLHNTSLQEFNPVLYNIIFS
tara:strand:- start:791 stop:1819 length:1029 start_codon:yes stop_codon:yes gene_type:complete